MQNLHYTTFCLKMNVLQDIHICTSVPITYLVQSFAFLSDHFRHFLAYVCFLSIRLVSICFLFVYQSILIVFACLVAVSQFSTYEIRFRRVAALTELAIRSTKKLFTVFTVSVLFL